MTLFDTVIRARDWIMLAGAVLFCVWFFAENEVMDHIASRILSRPLGENVSMEDSVREMREFRAEMRGLVSTLSDRVEALDQRLDSVEGDPTYILYDMVRSKVHEPCPTDGQCTFTVRAQRTQPGENCTAANVRLYVVDANADRYQVPWIDAPGLTPQATTDDYVTVTGHFALPDQAAEGVAEFFMIYDYLGCDPADASYIYKQRTPSMVFTIRGD